MITGNWINLEIYRYRNLFGWYLAEVIRYDILHRTDIEDLISDVKELIDPSDQYLLTMVLVRSRIPSLVRRSIDYLIWLRLPFLCCLSRRFHLIPGTTIDQMDQQPPPTPQRMFSSSSNSLGIYIPNKLH
jgi:hypothetical protein